MTGKDKMTYHSLAPSFKAPIDKMKAAVRGDGPPNSTSSEIKFLHFLFGEHLINSK